MNFKENLRSVYHWVSGAKKSYSQTGEDLIAAFYLAEIKTGFYVDVGANDPIHLSNTYLFYKKGWQGICVEPNSSKCGLLKSVRSRDKVLNLGVGLKQEELELYIFDPDTISTFSVSEAEEFKKLGHKLVARKKVRVMPLSQILENNLAGQKIDLLSVDTEGFNMQVLQSLDLQKFRPKIIIAEVAEYRGNTLQRQESEPSEYLSGQGYAKLADTLINAVYIEKNYAAGKNLKF